MWNAFHCLSSEAYQLDCREGSTEDADNAI